MMRWVVLLTLFLLILVNHLLWAAVIPLAGYPYGAPDEIHHFEVTRFIGQTGRVPIFGPDKDLYVRVRPGAEDEVHNRIYGWNVLFSPGAYIGAGSLIWALPLPQLPQQLWVARLFSVLCSLCVAYFAYRIAGHVWPGDRFLLWGTPLLVSTIPQVVFVGSYHNPDAFTMAATSASIFYGLKFLDDRGPRWVDALLFALSLGLVALAKLNGWLASGLFTGAVLLLSTGKIFRSRRLKAQWALVVLLPFLVLSSWFLFQQWHYGDILARDVFRAAWSADRPLSVPLAQRGYDLPTFFLRTDWLKTSFMSFWGVFGYMSVYLHPAFYWALALLCLASGIGWMVRLVGRTRGVDLGSRQVRALCMFAFVAAGLTVAAAWTSFYQDYQPQGRYLFPVLIPICVLLLTGWRALLPSPWWRSAGLAALCVGMPLFNLICLLAYVVPGMALQVRQEWFF